MLLMTVFQGLWTVANMPYHVFCRAASAPETVAQTGLPFDFENVELTNYTSTAQGNSTRVTVNLSNRKIVNQF